VLRRLWWWLRGVGADTYRQTCWRCGRTGQTHYNLGGCVRFKKGA